MRHYIPFSVSRTFWMPAAFAAVFTAGAAFAEAPPAPTLPPLPAPPPAPGYQQPPPAPGYQQPPPAPGYQQPPPGYQQQPPAGYQQQPPAGYQQQPPAGYAAPQPVYGPPPGYGQGGYPSEPPLPPPPKRSDLRVSIRYNLFDLLLGRVSGEFEYAFAGPFSLVVGPEYIFGDTSRYYGLHSKGAGIYGELGAWIEGRPLRGYFLKAHLGHRSTTITSDVPGSPEISVPQTLIGGMFGSQSIYAGWFSISGGIGVAYDLKAEERVIPAIDPATGRTFNYVLGKTGPFQNGFNILTQLSIGGSF